MKIYERFNAQLVENIPVELREKARWVCWKLEYREKERGSKIPVDPSTGRNASSTNSRTWGTFDEALSRFLAFPGLHGIGYVFHQSDGLTGIDFDDCVDAKTRELAAWAVPWVEKLATYTELSPSMEGLKLIIRGRPPGNLKRRNRIEMYSSERFFTVTGASYGEPRAIRDGQRELDELYEFVFQKDDATIATDGMVSPLSNEKLRQVREIPDATLLELAMKHKKFKALWEGSTAEYNDDESAATAALLAYLAYWTRGDGERIDRLFRASKLMRAKWNSRRGSSTWGRAEVANAVARATKYYDPAERVATALNDTANTSLFVSLYDQKFLYVDPWKEWLVWNETCWQRDANLAVLEATRTVQDELISVHGLAALLKDKPLATFVRQTGDGWRRAAIEKLARPSFSIGVEKLDADAMLLACANGVINLKTGELRAGRRDDLITRQVKVVFDAEATSPKFDEFLSEVMSGRAEMIEYLWRVLGYSLTGSYSERTFFILQGVGRNGKSTFVNVAQALLGEYARTAPISTFIKRQRPTDAPRDDIAFLAGTRMVVAQEADEEMTLDAALVKTLTGGDLFTARELYGKAFQFRPAFKLFLVTNHTPRIKESAQALWDRMHIVKFNYRIPEDRLDTQLTAKLLRELPGIFAKAVRGTQEWLERGLDPPPDVLEAKSELYEDVDILGQAFEELTITSPSARAPQTKLYRAYRAWATEQGIKYPVSAHTWNDRIRNLGYDEARADGAKIWTGLGLKADGGSTR